MRRATDYNDSDPELLKILTEHENTLLFPEFSADIAWRLGSALRDRFVQEKSPLGLNAAIQIRGFPQGVNANPLVLFATAIGNVSPGVGNLITGKSNVVSWTGKSTYLSRLDFVKNGVNLQEFGLTSPDFFMHGGGFPIRLVNSHSPVGVVIVSGMPSGGEDHQIIIDTLVDFIPQMFSQHNMKSLDKNPTD